MSPMVPTQSPDALLRAIEGTYRVLRRGLGWTALAFPVLLYAGGRLRDVSLRASLSAYYHTDMRDVFVGVLFATGAALFLYKGFSRQEDWALNLAGVFAVFVALFPTPPTGRFSIHGASAVLFFVCLAYVAIARATDTLVLLTNRNRVRMYRATYRALGVSMVALPLTAAALFSIWPYPEGVERPVVFFVEAGAIYAFGAFWIVKSREIREIQKQNGAAAAAGPQQGMPAVGRAV